MHTLLFKKNCKKYYKLQYLISWNIFKNVYKILLTLQIYLCLINETIKVIYNILKWRKKYPKSK